MPQPSDPFSSATRRPAWEFCGVKDPQLVRSDWTPASEPEIAGVRARQIANVLTDNGYLTEIYRKDWNLDDLPVEQVFQKIMQPGEVSAWHAHQFTTDRLFCAQGRVKVVLYDGRTDSPTCGHLSQYRLGAERPAVIRVPPGVWHGVQAISDQPAVVLNVVDRAYCYEDPDHWRLPQDDPAIPHRFATRA